MSNPSIGIESRFSAGVGYAQSVASFSPNFSGGSGGYVPDISSMTVGQALEILHEARRVIETTDWNAVYAQFVSLGYADDPALAPGLEFLEQLRDGDFSIFYESFDIAVEELAGYPSHTLLRDVFDLDSTPGGWAPSDQHPAEPVSVYPEPDDSWFPAEAREFVDLFFDELDYLSANPDVRQAVEAGYISAREHFEQFGFSEGRSTRPGDNDFDESTYLSHNPDVAAAVESGMFASGQAHYEQFGVHEHRVASIANAGFQEDEYLTLNPDVKQAIDMGFFSDAWQHFDQFGAGENRPFSFVDSLAQDFGEILGDALEFPSSVASYVGGELVGRATDMLKSQLSQAVGLDLNKLQQISQLFVDQKGLVNAAMSSIGNAMDQESSGPVDAFLDSYLPSYLNSLWDNVL